MRTCCTVALTAVLCMLHSIEAAQARSHETSRSGMISIALPSMIPTPRQTSDNPFVRTALAFTVSVCPTDVEYSIACRERALAEAAKRLGQIFLQVYTTRRVEGSLKVWFPLPTERNEQLRFLRDAEERAIKTVAAKLLTESDQRIASQTNAPGMSSPGVDSQDLSSPKINSPDASSPEDAVRKRTQQVEKWRNDASVEARKGINWAHDWLSKTHSYQLGLALHELARVNLQNQSGN
jgi:hypothetical protein